MSKKEYMKKYCQDNKEKLNKYKEKWADNNPEKVKEANKKWQINNRKKVNKLAREWYKNNREKVKQTVKRWRKDNSEKVNKTKREWYRNNKKVNYPLGYHLTEERKKKIAEVSKGNTNMLGKHHSEETKRKLSEASKGKMPKNNRIPGKWGNIERGYFNINGKEIFFRSKWEANYALYLDFLVKQKQIKKWTYEKDVFIFEKIKYGTRSYRPDFKIYNNDSITEYHEVKGYMDSKSKTKLKRMAKYYPDIKLLIIDKDVYNDIKNKLGKMLKFY